MYATYLTTLKYSLWHAQSLNILLINTANVHMCATLEYSHEVGKV